jgi:hemerythrin-like domain-containing protein
MPATALPSTGDPAPRSGVGCDTGDMVMIHNLYRKAFREARELVAAASDAGTVRAGVLADHLAELAESVHHHHHTEGVTLWDQLEAAAPGCEAHVERMKAQHRALSDALDELTALLPAWRASASSKDHAAVVAALDGVLTSLTEHLGDEEHSILPIASVAMTQAEWNKIGEMGRSGTPRDKQFVQLGFILDSMPEAERDAWRKKNLPGPVWLLYKLVGRRQYEKHRALVYGTS